MTRRTGQQNTPDISLTEQLYIALRYVSKYFAGEGDLLDPLFWTGVQRQTADVEEEWQVWILVRDAIKRARDEDKEVNKRERIDYYIENE